MPTAPLIICEKSGRWALAVRSVLRGSLRSDSVGGLRSDSVGGGLRIVETRTVTHGYEALAAAPASLVALEITGKNLSTALDFVAHVHQNFPAACVVALLDPSSESAAALLREAGVADVFCSPLESAAIACLAQRHADLAPADDRPLRESLAARLPWQAWATPGFAASFSPSPE